MYLLQFEYTLTLVEQATFEQYLMFDLRVIVIDVTLSDEEKIVKCGRKMRKFCSSYPSIGDKMKFVKISDFGYAYDFAFSAAIAHEDDDSDSVDSLIDNTGSTNFSLAIASGTSQNQCGAGSAATWGQFVSEHKQVNKRSIPALNRDRKRAHCHKSLKYIYFQNYPAQEACVRNITLKAGDYDGTVGDFIDHSEHHDKETQIISSVFMDDATTGECPFISSAESGVQAANSSNQYNASVVVEAQQFVSRCKSQYVTQTDGNSRLQYMLNLFVTLSSECRLLLKKIKISGATIDCIVADVVSIGNMCANGFACQNITYGAPGESMQETPLVDTYNVSSLVVASQTWLSSLNSSYVFGYKSYHNSIVNCCYSSQYGSNVTARIVCAKGYISTYSNSANNKPIQASYWKTKMPTVLISKVINGVISATYGTLGCFCGCTSC